MKIVSALSLALILCSGLCFPALADDATEAKATVEKGVALVKEKGREAALKIIGDPKGPFVKGNFYLFAGLVDKVTLAAHPYAAEGLVGPDLSKFKDPKGNLFFLKMKETAEGPGTGWVEYWWPIPWARTASRKKTYVMRVPGENLYVAGGYYEK